MECSHLSVSCSWFIVLLRSSVSLEIFCPVGLSIIENRVSKSPTVIVALCISPFNFVCFCYVHFGALLLDIFIRCFVYFGTILLGFLFRAPHIFWSSFIWSAFVGCNYYSFLMGWPFYQYIMSFSSQILSFLFSNIFFLMSVLSDFIRTNFSNRELTSI